jgi:hypothetical protein
MLDRVDNIPDAEGTQILIAWEPEAVIEGFETGFMLYIVSPDITKRRGTVQGGLPEFG